MAEHTTPQAENGLIFDPKPGHFSIVQPYGDRPVYMAVCQRCGWQSGKATTRVALMKLNGPAHQHERNKHVLPPGGESND